MTTNLPYLERIDELDHLSIVRLKGGIDKDMVPAIEERIRHNRRKGSTIDKNVLIDYALVEKIDSAAVAFHLVRLKEYEAKGFKIGFINLSQELKTYLQMFRLCDTFKIYKNERTAIQELNA